MADGRKSFVNSLTLESIGSFVLLHKFLSVQAVQNFIWAVIMNFHEYCSVPHCTRPISIMPLNRAFQILCFCLIMQITDKFYETHIIGNTKFKEFKHLFQTFWIDCN